MPRLTSAPLTQKIINATRPPKTGFTPLRDPATPGLSASDLGVGGEGLVARISLARSPARTSDMGSIFLGHSHGSAGAGEGIARGSRRRP